MISISNREGSVRFEKKGLRWWVFCRGLFHDGIGCAENRTEHSGLRSAELSKNNKSFKNKIHYITMIGTILELGGIQQLRGPNFD